MTTVLVVDDIEEVGRLVSRILTQEGYRVLVTQDTEEARRLCAEHPEPIDLLIADVLMPGHSGPALADYARSRRPRIRVCFISAYDRGLLLDRVSLDENLPFLLKPFTAEELLQKVREVLAASDPDRGGQ